MGDLEKRLKKAKNELEFWRKEPISDRSVSREAVWSFKVDRLEEQIDLYWKQRAHINWLHFGDRNTSFFHNACSSRRRRNRIGNLRKENGGWAVEEVEKKELITNYFLQLFSSSVAPSEQQLQQLLAAVVPSVTPEMNEILSAEFLPEEVKAALDAIGDLKAPGPDGMPAIFFKKYWDVVGEQVTQEVLNVLRGGAMPEGWNDTVISLIPNDCRVLREMIGLRGASPNPWTMGR